MNTIKKLSAGLIALLLALTCIGCHPKNEVAVTIGDVEFTSAYYMCALVYADTEARGKVDEALAEKKDGDSETASTGEVDYFSQKIEKKSYTKWVKDRAIEMLKEIAAYKTKCNDNKLKIKDEDKSNSEMYASYYWSSYGYSAMFEPNGVSEETFKQYMLDSSYSGLYFEHLYSKDGEKEIPEQDVKNTMDENYVLADVIEVDLSEKEEEEKTSLTDKFNGYVADLTAGKLTFKDVYNDYNGQTEEQEQAEETDSEELKPLDSLATVLGSDKTTNPSDNFETAKAMAVGEIKLVTAEDGSKLTLIVKQAVLDDPYYIDNLDLSSRYLIKQDEYEKDIKAFAKTLKCKTNDYAVDRFKVKKIVQPQAAQ